MYKSLHGNNHDAPLDGFVDIASGKAPIYTDLTVHPATI